MEKQCTKCENFKEAEVEFYKDSQKRDGYRSICKECCRNDRKERRKDPVKLNTDRTNQLKYQNERKAKNPKEYNDYYNRIRKKKYNSDPIYRQKRINIASAFKTKKRREDPRQRAMDSARSRVNSFLKRRTNSYSHHLGCKRDEFKTHIEKLFQPGMAWDNYGLWELDHKVPLALAYDMGSEEFKKACNYTNLQPLWIEDHIIKSKKDIELVKAFNKQDNL